MPEPTKPKYCYACIYGSHVGNQNIFCSLDNRDYNMLFSCNNFVDSEEYPIETSVRIHGG